MKNLLDHFRRKPAEAAAILPQPVKEPAPALPPGEPAAPKPVAAKTAKPSWHGTTAPAALRQRLTGQPDRATGSEMLTLTLGDFLDRIPKELIDGGEHDRSTPLPFDIGALSERIGRGETQIHVAEIFRRIPDIFRNDTVIQPDLTIRFPWSKVLTLIHQTKEAPTAKGLSAAGVETLSLKLKARKFRRPARIAPAPRAAAAKLPAAPSLRLAANPSPAAPAPNDAPIAPATTPPPTETGSGNSSSIASLDQIRRQAEVERQLTALAAEKDRARAETEQLRKELAEHLAQSALERDAAREANEKFVLFKNEHSEIVRLGNALQTERDAAVARAAEFGAEYDAIIARTGELTTERDEAVAAAAKLSAEHTALTARLAELSAPAAMAPAQNPELLAERDAALARATELTAERDGAIARTRELTAELETASARLGEVSAERDAALTRGKELTTELEAATKRASELETERDTATTRAQELLAERDAATARNSELAAERDTALALGREVTAERDVVATRLAEVTAERETATTRAGKLAADSDAAVSLATELTAERDAAAQRASQLAAQLETSAARIAELEQEAKTVPARPETPDEKAWESRAIAQFEADIEGYRNTIRALLEERDSLRKQLGPQPAAAPEPAATESPRPTEPAAPDAYTALFPQSQWIARTIGVLTLALLVIGLVKTFSFSPPASAGQFASAETAPASEPAFVLPTLTEADLPEIQFKLRTTAPQETMSLLPAGPLLEIASHPR